MKKLKKYHKKCLTAKQKSDIIKVQKTRKEGKTMADEITRKAVERLADALRGEVYWIPYCAGSELLRGYGRIAYNAGVYGWNFDVYIIGQNVVCTGYRGSLNRWKRIQCLREFNEKAYCIREKAGALVTYKECDEMIEKLWNEIFKESEE